MQGIVGQEAIGVEVLQVRVLLVMVLMVMRRVFEVGNDEVVVRDELWLVGSGYC